MNKLQFALTGRDKSNTPLVTRLFAAYPVTKESEEPATEKK